MNNSNNTKIDLPSKRKEIISLELSICFAYTLTHPIINVCKSSQNANTKLIFYLFSINCCCPFKCILLKEDIAFIPRDGSASISCNLHHIFGTILCNIIAIFVLI